MRDYPYEELLVPIVEGGHKNAGDIERIYAEVKGNYEKARLNYLGEISFINKSCLSLIVADSVVYAMFRKINGATSHSNPDAIPTGPASPPYYAGGTTGKAIITKVTLIDAMLSKIASEFSWIIS